MSLGERIKGISTHTSKEVIDTLYRIKDFGDDASHFNSDIKITSEQVEKFNSEAIGIFELIMIDYFRKNGFATTQNTAVIFSTLFPQIRANVLSEFANKAFIRKQYDREVFHKYIIALVKSGWSNKANRIVEKLYKNGAIDNATFKYEKKSIKTILEDMKSNELPIPKIIEDCRRNFNMVLDDLDELDKIANKGLIDIISKLLEHYLESEMGDFKPYKIYYFTPEEI